MRRKNGKRKGEKRWLDRSLPIQPRKLLVQSDAGPDVEVVNGSLIDEVGAVHHADADIFRRPEIESDAQVKVRQRRLATGFRIRAQAADTGRQERLDEHLPRVREDHLAAVAERLVSLWK